MKIISLQLMAKIFWVLILGTLALGHIRGVIPMPEQRVQETKVSLMRSAQEATPAKSETQTKGTQGLTVDGVSLESLVDQLRRDLWRSFWHSISFLAVGFIAAVALIPAMSRRTIAVCAIAASTYVFLWVLFSIDTEASSISSAIIVKIESAMKLIRLDRSWNALMWYHEIAAPACFLLTAVFAWTKLRLMSV